MRTCLPVLLISMLASGLRAQSPTFDVASIKPSAPGARGMTMRMGQGGISFESGTLRQMIVYAWDLRDFQVTGGPGWLGSESWDIAAKSEGGLPQGAGANAKVQGMLRALLIDRFQLAVHEETREMPIYAMVVAKSGLKVQRTPPDGPATSASWRGGVLKMNRGTMTQFAQMLSPAVGKNIYDETGLTGEFDFQLEFTPPRQSAQPGPDGAPVAASADLDGPSIFTALQEQLGLRLESKKGPVKMLIIDRAMKATEN